MKSRDDNRVHFKPSGDNTFTIITISHYEENRKNIDFCQEFVPTRGKEFDTTYECTLDAEAMDKIVTEFISNPPTKKLNEPLKKVEDLKKDPFIVGEAHQHISSKRFLIENMKMLKREGFEILFMEHFFYDTDQNDLDKFFQTKDAPLSGTLLARLKEMERHGIMTKDLDEEWEKYSFTDILYAARDAGIRVIGVDVSTTYKAQKIGYDNEQLDDKRQKYMNYTAYEIIKKETGPGKKWFALMGNTHVHSFANVPGVAELTGARSVQIFDTGNNSKISEVNLNSSYKVGNVDLQGDLVITQNPKESTFKILFQKEHEEASKIQAYLSDLKNSFKKKYWKDFFNGKPEDLKHKNIDSPKYKAIRDLRQKIEIAKNLGTLAEVQQYLKEPIECVIKTSKEQQLHNFILFKKALRNSQVADNLEDFKKNHPYNAPQI
ncbi:membrane-targeted effector domain-containing toxin [Legionella waltersii]|uniref:Haem-binding uptake Tiki superfamily ChaN domain-containing protein n=1 Tax=Legionella waltersii TaxID=66969 RepID=A0A0W0ZZY8_9GAMM|nr:membrane-targeted effector domain-containing toxin [Legionella waltersii]KTD74648.1 hypothetical protein Lwal_2689 [Legionella waltersii]SNV09010.1 C-terminal region of Pasteurella multocida toxin residues 569-1285 [Legionella waltersii]